MKKSGPGRLSIALLAAAFTAGISDTLLTVYLPLHLHRDFGEKNLLVIGMVIALPQLGLLVASNLWGAAGDRWRRLKPLIVAGVVGYALMLAALSLAHSSRAALVIVLCGSLFYAAYRPGALSYVTLRDPERKGHAVAGLMRAQSMGWFLGNLGFGALMTRWGAGGVRVALLVAAGVGLVSALLVWLRLPEISPGGAQAGARTGFRPVGFLEDLAGVYRTPALRWLAIVWFFTTAGRWNFYNFFPLLLTDFMHGSVTLVSQASAWSAFAGVALFSVAGHWVDRSGPRSVLRAAVIGYLVYFALNVILVRLYPSAHLPWVSLVAAGLFMIPIYPAFVVAGNAWVAGVVRAEQRSGGMGAMGGVEAAGALGGTLLGGSLASRFGLAVTPLTSTLLALTALFALSWLGVYVARHPDRNSAV